MKELIKNPLFWVIVVGIAIIAFFGGKYFEKSNQDKSWCEVFTRLRKYLIDLGADVNSQEVKNLDAKIKEHC